MTSHFESAVHAKRVKDAGKEPPYAKKCRLCRTNVEDVTHITGSYPFRSVRYYLPMRHDMVAKRLYSGVRKHIKNGTKGIP